MALMNLVKTPGLFGSPFEVMKSCHCELPLLIFDCAGCGWFARVRKGTIASPLPFVLLSLCRDKNNLWTLTSPCAM